MKMVILIENVCNHEISVKGTSKTGNLYKSPKYVTRYYNIVTYAQE